MNHIQSNFLKINDIINIQNSYITIFVKIQNKSNEYGIVFHDPIQNKNVQIFDSNFSLLYKKIISDFQLGLTTGSIVGLARERTPADQWYSDTIERSYQDKNSLHQGIIRIIEKEDGIPVYMNSNKIIGNISPALAYSLKGTPLQIQNILNKYNRIQKNIIVRITAGKPKHHNESLARSCSAGDGFKSENRLSSINRTLEKLAFARDNSRQP